MCADLAGTAWDAAAFRDLEKNAPPIQMKETGTPATKPQEFAPTKKWQV